MAPVDTPFWKAKPVPETRSLREKVLVVGNATVHVGVHMDG